MIQIGDRVFRTSSYGNMSRGPGTVLDVLKKTTSGRKERKTFSFCIVRWDDSGVPEEVFTNRLEKVTDA